MQATSSKILKTSLDIHLKAGYAQFNRNQSDIFVLEIESFLGRWSRGTKTLCTKVVYWYCSINGLLDY